MGSAFDPTVASATTSRPVQHGPAIKNPAPFQSEPAMHTGAAGHVAAPMGSFAKPTHQATFQAAKAPSAPIVHSRRV